MAKQTVGPIVRHVEKAVLGICAGVFLYIVAMYGVVSPNKVELTPGQPVGPEGLGQEIKSSADNLVQRLQTSVPKQEEVEGPLPRLEDAANPLDLAKVPATIPRPTEFSVPPPKLPGPVIADKRPLVEVVQLSAPKVSETLRSGLYLAPPTAVGSNPSGQTESVYLRDVNWVTVRALFDRVAQVTLCKENNYAPSNWQTVFLGVDVERRELLGDETWSEWTAINPWSIWAELDYPAPDVFEMGGQFNVGDADREDVDSFVAKVTTNDAQLGLIRPLPPEQAYGDQWYYPRLEDGDLLAMDAEYQENPHCRYPECENVKVDQMSYDDLMDQAQRAMDDGRLDQAKTMAEAAEKAAKTSRDERDAKKLVEEIAEAIAKNPEGTKDRQRYQCLWIHDARMGSLVSGRTYQYRMRPRIYNHYCAKPTLLENPEDAEQVALVGPWSEPSKPVRVPRDTLFYVTSSREQRNEAKIEVYKWYRGHWLEHSFSVVEGEPIGEPAKEPAPPTGEREEIDFATGSKVIDIDFHRIYRPRDRRGRLQAPAETTAVVYVDDNGQLFEKLEAVDKDDPLMKAMGAQVWKP